MTTPYHISNSTLPYITLLGVVYRDSSSHPLFLLYILHLLGFDWQAYDHALLNELQLPEFFVSNAIRKYIDLSRLPIIFFSNDFC